MIVSIDFDKTFERKDVQAFVHELIVGGHDVRITTSRYKGETDPLENLDVIDLAFYFKISFDNIHFTEGKFKHKHLDGKDIVFHLDDNIKEIDAAGSEGCSVPFVNVGDDNWEKQCKKLMKDYQQ